MLCSSPCDRRVKTLPWTLLGGFNSRFDRLGTLSFDWHILRDLEPPTWSGNGPQPSFYQLLPVDQGSGVEEFYPPELAAGTPSTFGVGIRDGMAEAVAVWIGMTLDDGEPIGRPPPNPPRLRERLRGREGRGGEARHGSCKATEHPPARAIEGETSRCGHLW
jgi:hypothetical protein